MSVLDQLAESGTGPLLEYSDGELILVLDGPDADKQYIASITIEPDLVATDLLSVDVRGHRRAAFRKQSGVPNLGKKNRIKRLKDGKIYTATIQSFDDYVFQVFDLQEVTTLDS